MLLCMHIWIWFVGCVVMFAYLLWQYIYIISGEELTRLAKDYIKFVFGGSKSVRLKRAMYKWGRFYQKLTEKKQYDEYWLEKAIINTPTWWDHPDKYRRAVMDYMESQYENQHSASKCKWWCRNGCLKFWRWNIVRSTYFLLVSFRDFRVFKKLDDLKIFLNWIPSNTVWAGSNKWKFYKLYLVLNWIEPTGHIINFKITFLLTVQLHTDMFNFILWIIYSTTTTSQDNFLNLGLMLENI